MLTNTPRNASATPSEYTYMYYLKKEHFEQALEDFPFFRKKLILRAIEENKKLTSRRKKLLKKQPVYGFSFMKKDALRKIKTIFKDIERTAETLEKEKS